MNVAKGRLDQFIKWLVSKFSNNEIVTDDNINSKVPPTLTSSAAGTAIKSHFIIREIDTTVGVISANGGTKWVTLNKPTNAFFPWGFYIYNSGNTRCNIYAWSTSSVAICNLATSATGSDLKITTRWLCIE